MCSLCLLQTSSLFTFSHSSDTREATLTKKINECTMVNVSLHMVHTIGEKHANTPGVETNVIYLSFPPYKIFLYYI